MLYNLLYRTKGVEVGISRCNILYKIAICSIPDRQRRYKFYIWKTILKIRRGWAKRVTLDTIQLTADNIPKNDIESGVVFC